jgi:hypothetical protein
MQLCDTYCKGIWCLAFCAQKKNFFPDPVINNVHHKVSDVFPWQFVTCPVTQKLTPIHDFLIKNKGILGKDLQFIYKKYIFYYHH